MIDLRCCDVAEVLDEVRGAALVTADPPWVYNCKQARDHGVASSDFACVGEHYDTLTLDDIAAHVSASYACATDSARLLLWTTFPQLADWMAADAGRWRYVTGGAWTKDDRLGQGHHWRGMVEPLLVYVKGSNAPINMATGNAYISKRTEHSQKPMEWLCTLLETWTNPGDLVLDLYAGLAPMARACKATGRDYIGAEIDPERHRHAMAKLDGTPWHRDVRQIGLGI